MMIQIFIASLLLVLSGCQENKEIKVNVNTVGANDKGAYKSVALELNKELQNVRAEIDRDKSLIKVEFDYPRQKWPFTYYNQSAPFLIRLFDKNGNVLQYFTTKETFISSQFKSLIKKKLPNLSHPKFDNSIPLKEKGNVLTYQIDIRNAEYVKAVEFGWGAVNWYDHGKGYYEKFSKKVPDNSCVNQEEMKIYEMTSKNIPKFGVYCQRPKEGKIIFEGDKVSVYLPEACLEKEGKKIYPSKYQCCARDFPRKRDGEIKYFSGVWQLKGKNIVQEKNTGSCKCPEGLILTERHGEAYCSNPKWFFSDCIDKKSNPFWRKDKEKCMSICKYSNLKNCKELYEIEVSKKTNY